MTISAIWRWGGHAYVCSDTAESGRADTTFPVSSFDEAASASDFNAQERAMKLVQVGTHGIATASGDGRVARRIMDQLNAMTSGDLGRGVDEALRLAAHRAGLDGRDTARASWLCAEWRHGTLSTYRWPDGRPECRDATALLAGNLTNDLADGFCGAGEQALAELQAQRDAGARLPPTAEISMIAGTFQAFIVAEGLCAARGIGGGVVAARVGSNGVEWMPDTLYVISNPDLVRRVAASDGETVGLADLASFVVCLSVREGCLFLRSTGLGGARVLIPGEEKRAEGRWRARWERDMVSPAFWSRCQAVVFLNPVQRGITTILGDFTRPNQLVVLAVEAGTGELLAEFGTGLREHLTDTGKQGEPWKAHIDVIAPYVLPGQVRI